MPLQNKLSNEYDGEQTELEQTSVRRILLFPFHFCVKKLQLSQFCADVYLCHQGATQTFRNRRVSVSSSY